MRFDPQIHERVVAAYAEIGLPREQIGSWCLPMRDALVLVEALDPARHRRILEIGTWVGVSTMLLALHAPDSVVHSVDPNLPLKHGTPFEGIAPELEARGAQEIARMVAERLGVADRLVLHQGGFAVGADYASRRGASADAGSDRSIVGPGIMRDHGPFDFVFVDGLHYADAVAADLELAAGGLAERGIIALHDVIGLWGANVRWATHRFLEAHPEFVLRHEPYRELYYAIGLLLRRGQVCDGLRAAHPDRPAGGRLIDEAEFRGLLVGAIEAAATTAGPARLIEIAVPGQPSLADAAARRGIAIARVADADALRGLEPAAGECVLALGALDHLDDAGAAVLLEAIARRGGRALLGATPPGERGIDGPWSRTLPATFALLEGAGLSVAGDLRLALEPHLSPYWTRRPRPNSHLLHLLLVEPCAEPGPERPRHGLLSPARIESDAIGLLFRDLLTLHLMGGLKVPTSEQPPPEPPPAPPPPMPRSRSLLRRLRGAVS